MSKFLGPIHYWLYDKIGNQEKLTAAIAKYAESKGLIASTAPYVKELPPLESVIDETTSTAGFRHRSPMQKPDMQI